MVAKFPCQKCVQGSFVRRTTCIKLAATETGCAPFKEETSLDPVPRSPNGFLSSLAADDFELIRQHLRTADLVQEHVLVERDSIFGSFSAIGDATALNSAVVLVPGVASTIDLDHLRAAADQSAALRVMLMRHGMANYAEIQQTAGCNASHTVESRLARCLLHTRDLSGSDKLVLTQESMAQMIGARRNSVSLVANTLQQANFIRYSRGHIEITDLDGLSKTSCECYATVKAQYERLLHLHCLS